MKHLAELTLQPQFDGAGPLCANGLLTRLQALYFYYLCQGERSEHWWRLRDRFFCLSVYLSVCVCVHMSDSAHMTSFLLWGHANAPLHCNGALAWRHKRSAYLRTPLPWQQNWDKMRHNLARIRDISEISASNGVLSGLCWLHVTKKQNTTKTEAKFVTTFF